MAINSINNVNSDRGLQQGMPMRIGADTVTILVDDREQGGRVAKMLNDVFARYDDMRTQMATAFMVPYIEDSLRAVVDDDSTSDKALAAACAVDWVDAMLHELQLPRRQKGAATVG